uniref:Uncharacterized protein n=1 Tax=Caenorhabditis japonica TaxID=281687 RepID=A0A8R1EFS3_CAEJA
MKSVPDFVREFCFKDDEVCESVRLHGKRFSTVKTGKSDDTCVQFVEGDEVFYGRLVAIFIGEYRGIRFLLKRFRTSLAHLKLVMDRCLKTEGEVQKYRDIADVLSNSSFGATLTDYGAYVVVKSENVMGHAITSIVGNLLIVLPVTNRITCS